MAYTQIAITTVTREREDGTQRSYQIILKELNGTFATTELGIVGDIVKVVGGNDDGVIKPYKTTTITGNVKDEGLISKKLISAGYREFQVEITETVSGEIIFDGFVLPDFSQYDVFKDIQTVTFSASDAIKDMQDDAVEDTFKTLREFYNEGSVSSGIDRSIDFITRLRDRDMASSAQVPNLTRVNERDLLNSDEANKFESMSQLGRQMLWQLVYHNGRWVVQDLYEKWLNPTALRRYVDDGLGTYSVTSENRLVTLDQSNSIQYPSGRGEKSAGRIVLQRGLYDRAGGSITTISQQTLTYPPINQIASITRTASNTISGDKYSIREARFTLSATNNCSGMLKAIRVSFTSDIDGSVLYFDPVNNEWSETESFIQYQFDLVAGGSIDFDLSSELPPIPENQYGSLEFKVQLDIDFTTGTKDDIDNLFVRFFSVSTIILPDEEVPVLYRQWEAVSQDGAGVTEVTDYYMGTQDTRVTSQFMQAWDGISPWKAIVEFADEEQGVNKELGDIIHRRWAILRLGKSDTITLGVRDTTGINALSTVSFDDGDSVRKCLPVRIKHYLFSGDVELKIYPVNQVSFTLSNQYSFTKIESSDSKVGGIGSSNPAGNTFLTGAFYDSMLNKALSMTYTTQTTAILSGTVTAIPVNKTVTVGDGESIAVINPFTLKIREFVADGDQNSTLSLNVVPKYVDTSFPTGSFVSVDFDKVTSSILVSKFAVKMLARANGIGVLTEEVSGTVSSLPVQLWTQIRANETFGMIIEDAIDPITVTVGGVEGSLYDAGAHALPLKDAITLPAPAPAGTILAVTGVQLQSYLHIDPGQVVINVEKRKTVDSIGSLSVVRTEGNSYDTIVLENIEGTVKLRDGQELVLFNQNDDSEFVTVDGDQDITTLNPAVDIISKVFENTYDAPDVAWLREAMYSYTGRINVEADRIDANVTSIGENSTAVSGLELRTTDAETAIANLKTHVNFDGGASYSSLSLRSDLDGASANISANLGLIQDNQGDIGSLQADAGVVIFSSSEPTERLSGDDLEDGDIWVDTTLGSDALPINEQYVRKFNHGDATQDYANWLPNERELKINQAGLSAKVDNLGSKAIMYAGSGGDLAFVSAESGDLTPPTVRISGAYLRVDADAIFEGDVEIKGILTATNFNGGTISTSGIELETGTTVQVESGESIRWKSTDGFNNDIFAYMTSIRNISGDYIQMRLFSEDSLILGHAGFLDAIEIQSASGGRIDLKEDTYYKGDEISTLGTNAVWTSVAGRPFTSLSVSEFDVVSDELRIDEIPISKVTNLQTELNSKADSGDIPTNVDNYQGWDLETNGVFRTQVGSQENLDFAEGSGIDVSYGTFTVTISHQDTSSQGSVNNSGTSVIQDITLDTFGHVTNINSKTIAKSDLSLDTTDTVRFGRLGIGANADSTYKFRVQTDGSDFFVNQNGNVQVGGTLFAEDVKLS